MIGVSAIGELPIASLPAANSNVTVALTGKSATFTAGTLGVSSSAALTGQVATFSSGTVTPSVGVTVGLTGQAATFTAGTLSPSTSVAVSGTAATFTAGTVVPGISVAQLGSTANFAAGALSPSSSVALTGKAFTATAGTVAPSASVSLTGQSGAFSAGNLAPSLSVAVAGQAATFSSGTVAYTDPGIAAPAPSQDAGSASAAVVVHIFQVTMNGQTREFGSYKAACDYIQQTKLAAQKAARKAVSRATQGKRTQIAEPKLTVNAPTLKPLADEMEAKIRQIYRQASIDMEIALHFAMQRESENDQIIMWMM